MSDAREDMRDAIGRGLRAATPLGERVDFEECVDSIMAELMETTVGENGWFILGSLEHVYRVTHTQMVDASPVDHSVWVINTRNDL